jgi:hypothetical protein
MSNSNILSGANNPNYRHGGLVFHRKEFNSWRAMRERCTNENNDRYPDWGGRGIKVCDRWDGEDGFKNFLSDMGKKPSLEYTLDRIDNNGDYTPENCRWATPSDQSKNKRIYKTNKSGHTGISYDKTSKKWMVRVYVDGQRKYIGIFKTLNQAINAKNKHSIT